MGQEVMEARGELVENLHVLIDCTLAGMRNCRTFSTVE